MMYDYECSSCRERVEHNLPYPDRANPPPCECGGELDRIFVNAPKARKLTRYGGMKAMIVDHNEKQVGEMKGHFGATAKLERKK